MKKIPQDVYYRCIWVIKGSVRMREMISLSERETLTDAAGAKKASAAGSSIVSEAVLSQAEKDLECIDHALQKIPGAYRAGVLGNIIDKQPFGDMAHPNTWKRWKQEFIYQLARELHLI